MSLPDKYTVWKDHAFVHYVVLNHIYNATDNCWMIDYAPIEISEEGHTIHGSQRYVRTVEDWNSRVDGVPKFIKTDYTI